MQHKRPTLIYHLTFALAFLALYAMGWQIWMSNVAARRFGLILIAVAIALLVGGYARILWLWRRAA